MLPYLAFPQADADLFEEPVDDVVRQLALLVLLTNERSE